MIPVNMTGILGANRYRRKSDYNAGMARDLKEMTCVITGASAGIGAELAKQLSARGARLVLAARRADRLEQLNTELGGRHVCVVTDVAKREDCTRLIDQSIASLGRIDTLVCNAGYGLYERTALTTPDQMREIFATNVFGTTDCIAAGVPHLMRNTPRDGWRGQVMIVSSCVARRGVPFLGAYSATKSAQLSIAEALRVELAEHQIGVTSVHPIMTKTEFGQQAESRGQVALPKSQRDMFTQTVGHVVRCMVRAIERPRPEVWPSLGSRIGFALGGLMPGLIDRGMKRYCEQVVEANRSHQ